VAGTDAERMIDDFDHHDPQFIADPVETYQALRERCPVLRSERHGGFWFVSRYEDVRAASKDWERFTSAVPNVSAIPSSHPRTEPDLPIEADPPEHTRYRQLISAAFARHRVEEMKPAVQAVAAGLLDRLLAAGSGDLVSDFAVPLSVGTLARFMGLPDEDRTLWVDWVRRMYDASDPDGASAAAEEYHRYIDELVASRDSASSGDFVSMLLASEFEGQRLSPRGVASFMRVLLIAGHETTAAAMGSTLHWLATHPRERALLAANPAMIPTAIEEFLRIASPVVLTARNAVGDLEWHGSSIRHGDVVGLALGAANLDPDAFADPATCVLDRTPNRHVAFGSGRHLCVGAHVARLELTVMLEEWGARVSELALRSPVSWNRNGTVRGLASLPVSIG
jgi:cytochrome P450